MESWQLSTFSLLLTENQLRKRTKHAYAKERQHGFGHDEGIQNSSFGHTKVHEVQFQWAAFHWNVVLLKIIKGDGQVRKGALGPFRAGLI